MRKIIILAKTYSEGSEITRTGRGGAMRMHPFVSGVGGGREADAGREREKDTDE